jgi:hypothetical protein
MTTHLNLLADQPGEYPGFSANFSAFLGIEAAEFAGLVRKAAGPSRSGFLSSYFALVGMHGARTLPAA